jgi:hypothetical protein
MSDIIKANKVPSFVLYLISLSTTFMLTSSIMMLFDSTSASTARAEELLMGGTVLIVNFILSSIEIFLLRKNFGRVFFVTSFIFEIGKIFGTLQFVTAVDNQLLLALGSASLFSLIVAKLFTERITKISGNALSKNLTQILPTIGIILLFTGSSLLSTIGLAPVSQSPDPQAFNVDNINFSLFKTPSWNAQYYLDNILDQFRSGLNEPFIPVFNVTNNSPDEQRFGSGNQKISSYLKDKTYFDYKYDSLKAKSGTFFPADTGTTSQNVYLSKDPFTGQTFSKPVPDSFLNEIDKAPSARDFNVYSLTVTKEINHTDLYEDILPLSWNSRTYGKNGGDNSFYGSFIDPKKVEIYSTENALLDTCSPLSGLTGCTFVENQVNIQNFPGISDVGLRLEGFSNSAERELLKYTSNYLEPNYNYITTHSGFMSDYQNLFDTATWNAISAKYLQIPKWSEGTTPNASMIDYTNWAPEVASVSQQYFSSQATVMQNVLALLNAMSPSIHSQALGLDFNGGALNLEFDADFWFTQTRFFVPEAGIHYPNPDTNQDYVEWFIGSAKKGLSSEFAAAMTMILRLQGIPARFVTGYALGNITDSASTDPFLTVYQRLHKFAWTEVLVPINTGSGFTFEWVIADPIGAVLAQILGINQLGSQQSSSTSTQMAVLDPYSFDFSADLTTPAGQSSLGNSINRVGVDQKNNLGVFDGDTSSDNGIIESNGPLTTSTLKGIVEVSAFVATLYLTDTAVTSISAAGSTAVTFQVVYYDTGTNTTVSKLWNTTDTKSTVMSDPVTGIATTTFSYIPFNPGFTVLHGQGAIHFVAILSDTLTVDDSGCRDGSSRITCASAFSDSSRLDSDSYNYNTNTPIINFAPHDLVIGNTPLEAFNSKITSKIVSTINPPLKVFPINSKFTLLQPIDFQKQQENFTISWKETSLAIAIIVVLSFNYCIIKKKILKQ